MLSPVWYFYVHFMGHLFFLLKISCAFLEVGVGGSGGGKSISPSHLQICSVNWSLYLLWVWALAFHAPFLDVLTNIFQPRPFLFNERKAVKSCPLILETPSGWPGQFPFPVDMKLVLEELESLNICFYGSKWCHLSETPPAPHTDSPDSKFGGKKEKQKGIPTGVTF